MTKSESETSVGDRKIDRVTGTGTESRKERQFQRETETKSTNFMTSQKKLTNYAKILRM